MALLATVCDIPATCKIGGFLSHSSQHACWKCTRKFKYDQTLKRVNFSGIDTGLPRTHEEHERNAAKTVMASSPSEWNNIESQYGSRFRELMYLPYYDCVCFAIIDPMHNMFLGTAKRMLQMQWVQNGILNRNSLNTLQETVDNCVTMSNMGRIPRKIASQFSNLTAE